MSIESEQAKGLVNNSKGRMKWRQLQNHRLLSASPERARSVKASAADNGVQRLWSLAAGFGDGGGVPKTKAAEPLPVQPPDFPVRSILAGQHNRDGRLRVVNVEGAASSDELNQLRAAVVVADIEREG